MLDFNKIMNDYKGVIPMEIIQVKPEPFMVRIWPDNTWAIVEDIREGEYDWKSDDYQDIDMCNFEQFNKLDQALQNELAQSIMG